MSTLPTFVTLEQMDVRGHRVLLRYAWAVAPTKVAYAEVVTLPENPECMILQLRLMADLIEKQIQQVRDCQPQMETPEPVAPSEHAFDAEGYAKFKPMNLSP